MEYQIIFPWGWEYLRIEHWLEQRGIKVDRECFKGGYDWHVIYYRPI